MLSRQILERMISDLMQVQLAKENGIKVDDATLDKTIERIAQENNMPMTDFRAALDKDGVKFPRFREDIRQEILLSRLREREVDNNVVVTDAEVETEIAREAKEATSDSEYRLSHILVMVPQQATPEQIEQRRRRAVLALTELRKGTSFAQVAASYSDAPDALQGGNLGWRPSARLPQLFLDVIDKMQPGDVRRPHAQPERFPHREAAGKARQSRGHRRAADTRPPHPRSSQGRALGGRSSRKARGLRKKIDAGGRFRGDRQDQFGRCQRRQGW